MKQQLFGALAATVLLVGAYTVGRLDKQLSLQTSPELSAQGRGPRVPPKPRSDRPTKAAEPLVFGGDGGSAAISNNGFMAVTGSYGIGTSVLYLFDTNNKQLLVYEARGGSRSMRRLILVGARRIDMDLQLIDYNDESEFRRDELSRMFKTGKVKNAKSSSVTAPGGLKKGLGTGKYKTTKKGGGR